MDKKTIEEALNAKDFEIEGSDTRLMAEKDGYCVTVLFDIHGVMTAVLEEITDTSSIIKLIAKPEKGINLSVKIDDKVRFIRTDGISETVLSI